MPENNDYRVDVDVYSGPLDLLLYLIRREEVDIWDIPIARVTDQYLKYLTVLETINVNVAGEFVEMAATLLEIKSRMLLPRESPDSEEPMEDPRTELVQQLLEYKRFKDAARTLEVMRDDRMQRFSRGVHLSSQAEDLASEEIEATDLLSGVSMWDLLSALQTVLKEIKLDVPRRVVYDETPIEEHCAQLLARLRERGSVMFSELFREAQNRSTVIGQFLALLELIRLKALKVEQTLEFGEIHIVFIQEPSLQPQGTEAAGEQTQEARAPVALDPQSDSEQERSPEEPDIAAEDGATPEERTEGGPSEAPATQV